MSLPIRAPRPLLAALLIAVAAVALLPAARVPALSFTARAPTSAVVVIGIAPVLM